MEILSEKRFLKNKARYCRKITEGSVFIYPTDTIYGIGCDATNNEAVKRIREIKKRSEAPFSVAAPSKEWIRENCVLSAEAKNWLNKLPGPYTLLLKLRNRNAVAPAVIQKKGVLGVRIPDNWFSSVVAELGAPVVSTSANITAKRHMTSLNDLNEDVEKKVDFIVYEGKKEARPSTIVKLYAGKVETVER